MTVILIGIWGWFHALRVHSGVSARSRLPELRYSKMTMMILGAYHTRPLVSLGSSPDEDNGTHPLRAPHQTNELYVCKLIHTQFKILFDDPVEVFYYEL